MSGSSPTRLGGIAALFLLWFVTWLVLGTAAFGPTHYNWDQAAAAVFAAIAAFWAYRHTSRPYRLFLVLIGVGLVLLAVSWATYNADDTLAPRFSGLGLDYSDISYALFVLIVVCAWGYLALEQWQRRPPSTLTGVVFAVLVVGLAIILASFYYPEYRSAIGTNAGRLDAVTSGLEFAALIAGFACILLGEPPAVTWMLIATALLVAGDMAYAEVDVPNAIQVVWMLGQLLFLSAMLVLPYSTKAAGVRAMSRQMLEGNGASAGRSGLSGILILVSIGCVLLSVVLGLVPVHPVWKSFFAVLFVVALMVAMVWLTDRFDETVTYLKAYTSHLLQRPLQADDWRDADARIRATLQSTGLGAYLDTLRGAADRLKEDVLFLGPERLYPSTRPRRQPAVRCFIVMPFSREWSNDVHRTVGDACRAMSVQPVRGDDLFTPTDILVDIWHSINSADFVIADITGRNANVLYELGIAHTLAKPVLIIASDGADIPIDLSTRRVIVYPQSGNGWRDDLHAKVTRAISEIVNLYGFRVMEAARHSPNDMPVSGAPAPVEIDATTVATLEYVGASPGERRGVGSGPAGVGPT